MNTTAPGRLRSLILLVALAGAVSALAVKAPATAIFAAENGRDLAKASPESVGVSAERLKRLEAGMHRFVDDGRLAGVSTFLARRGKTIHYSAFGKKDVNSPEPI